MRRYFIASAVFMLTTSLAMAQNSKWAVDKGHSNVKFTVTHMTVSEVDGSFKVFDGRMEHTKADFSDAKISFLIDVNSINTDSERRDGHLKGEEFFAAAKYPEIKFESTSMKPMGGNKYQLSGNMTVKDVTRPVTWDVSYGGVINTQRGKKAGFKAKTSINRFDYNLKWGATVEAGGLVVGEMVDVVVNIELNEVK